eukprot:354602-Chlamydomonas_euryale.AAC.1
MRLCNASTLAFACVPACAAAVLLAGHDYDSSGVFATDPKDPPGPGAAPVACARHRPHGMCVSRRRRVLGMVPV